MEIKLDDKHFTNRCYSLEDWLDISSSRNGFLLPEITQWLDDNGINDYEYKRGKALSFRNENDAAMFKLRWL